jgi:hypothetical protein
LISDSSIQQEFIDVIGKTVLYQEYMDIMRDKMRGNTKIMSRGSLFQCEAIRSYTDLVENYE